MFPAIIRFATEVHELMMSQRRNLRGPDVWGQNDENMTKPPKKTHRYLADPSWWFFDVFFSWCFVSTYIFSSPFGFDMLWEWCQMLWILGLKGTYCNMHTKRSSLQTIREFTMVCQVPSCRLHHNCSCSYCRILCIYMFHKMFHKMFQVFGSIRFNMFQHVSTCFNMFQPSSRSSPSVGKVVVAGRQTSGLDPGRDCHIEWQGDHCDPTMATMAPEMERSNEMSICFP